MAERTSWLKVENFEGIGEVTQEDWDATPEPIRRLNAQLLLTVEALRLRVSDLEEKLRTNSTNSSLPPSTDRPAPRNREERRRSKRKRGGQPGHEGHQRELVPESEVDETVDCPPPARCQDCDGAVYADGSCRPDRHQVWELPQVSARVTEYRLIWGQCIGCEAHWRGDLPLEVGEGMLGVRAMLWKEFKAGTIDRQALVRKMAPIRRTILEVLEQGEATAGLKTSATCTVRRCWSFVMPFGPSWTTRVSSRRTTRRSARFALQSCGVSRASAQTARTGRVSPSAS